jgi:RpiB/LacA/LacB family sugar-phosphate isomerase
MRIALGADHAGFELKELLGAHLIEHGHEVRDVGTDRADVPVDYPEFGAAVGRLVAEGEVDLGLCACGTGIGISMAANKVPGVRAALVHDVTTARLARMHNHANVACLGGRTVGTVTAIDAVEAFLAASPAGGRHVRRVAELAELDAGRVVAPPQPMGTTP